MQCGLVQCSARAGDFAGNLAHLGEILEQAPEAELYCLPPNALCGVTVASLGLWQAYARAQEQALSLLAARHSAKTLLVPYLQAFNHNDMLGCVLLAHGCRKKISLNSLTVQGNFAFGSFCLGSHRVGILLAVQSQPDLRPLIFFPPWTSSWPGQKPDCLLVLSAIAWREGLQRELEGRYSDLARTFDLPVAVVSAVGAEDGMLYPGMSLVMDRQGILRSRGLAFAEDIVLTQTEKITAAPQEQEALWEALVMGTRDFVHHCGLSRAFVGLSGGLDSALVLAIACAALGADNVTAVFMPSPYTSQASREDAAELIRNLAVPSFTVPIEPLMASLTQALAPSLEAFPVRAGDVTFENLQARIRAVILSSLANRAQGLVLNTSNKSEAAMGYSTLYGDTIGALAVIGDLTKTQVYVLATWYRNHFPKSLEIPRRILEKAPSAELAPNQKDSDSLPVYAELDPHIEQILQGRAEYSDLTRRLLGAEFKRRQEPLALFVSSRPFTAICRYPVSGRFQPVLA
ncbi:MAG: NAD(+) synthase [Desulfovibrio sp.]|nr:NAD(+) synthase [Desulfovibrio sp.]